MTYSECVQYIESVPKFTSKNRLENTVELLRRLGHPEESLKIIHVAGTNGKGSVCAYLESMLREAGCSTGLFISPHLVRINERFQIGRVPVGDGEFTSGFETVMKAVRSMEADGYPHPSYFELLFAMGMLIFRRQGVDWTVMETGLGGRLDATNTVARPALSVITSISFDHMEYLGDTIPRIASEKAGIIKSGVPVVYDAFRDRGQVKVIEEKAQAMGSRTAAVTQDMVSAVTFPQACGELGQGGIDFTIQNRYYDCVRVRIPFYADYQVENCAVAMTAAALLRERGLVPGLTDRAILDGVRRVRWQGRMEPVMKDVLVDGAHNPDGISQFLRTARRISETRSLSLLFTAVREKDYDRMIREICGQCSFTSIVTTEAGGSRRVSARILAEIFRKYAGCSVTAVSDPDAAFDLACRQKKDGVLLCVGSLYLAGRIEAHVHGLQVN